MFDLICLNSPLLYDFSIFSIFLTFNSTSLKLCFKFLYSFIIEQLKFKNLIPGVITLSVIPDAELVLVVNGVPKLLKKAEVASNPG